MPSVRALARLERAEFAALLDGLTPEQWEMPSLCAGWRVRDVAAHTVAYLGQNRRRLLVNMIRVRGDVDRLNEQALRDGACLQPAELVALMHRGVEPAGAAALYGGRVALIECLIHQQDIRRPLRLPRTIPAAHLGVSLNYARLSPVIGGARRSRGVRLIATDMDWAVGRGPEVCASGEALLLAMTGRVSSVRAELDGPGVGLLR